MIREWVPAEKLGCTIEVNAWADGRLEGVSLSSGMRSWRGDYSLPTSLELAEYAQGKRRSFSQELTRARIGLVRGAFRRAALLKAMEIPYGQTMAYSEIAQQLSSKAWRAVGSAMAGNPVAILIPCHRVVAKHGIGGFGGDVEMKRRLLEFESAHLR